jgi:inorganic triphosphatase YgiF
MRTELKLRLLPEVVDELVVDHRLRGSPITRQHLVSVYYDTEDAILHQHGYALCTRWSDGNWWQVFRSDGRQSQKKLERVDPVEGRAVDRSKLPVHGKVGVQLHKILADQSLQPRFQVELQRTRWNCSVDEWTQVTVILDKGEINAVGRAERINELRLCLSEGELTNFYSWVLGLAKRRQLIWESDDEVIRGYKLLNSTPITHVKAAAISLAQGSSGEAAFATIIMACLEQMHANLAATCAGQSEGVHQLRVALRRLRSCLRIFRPLIPKEASADLVAELRWLNGLLGPARDWDVFLEEGMAPIFTHFPEKSGLRSLQRKAELIRQSHRQALYKCLGEARYHRLILRLHGWLACREWQQHLSAFQREGLEKSVIEFASPLLAKLHRRVAKSGERFTDLTKEERHALRIRIKQLRYALEFFASLYHDARVEAYVKAAAGLQDSLGSLNDMVVAERLLDEAKLGRATPTRHLIDGWYAANGYYHEQQFQKRWEQFTACKPPWKQERVK